MNQRQPGVGCGAAIVRDGKLLLIQRRRPPEAGHWNLPGGKAEFLERLEDAVIREIREEIGVAVVIKDFLCLVQMLGVDGQHWVSPVYRASLLGGEPCLCEPDKISAVAWFDLDRLPAPLAQAASEAATALKLTKKPASLRAKRSNDETKAPGRSTRSQPI